MYKCTDVDECSSKIQYCGSLRCQNTEGSFICGCGDGFERVENECFDIDECEASGSCPKNSTCRNSIGSFSCDCDPGYEGEQCADIDECLQKSSYCDENATCTNTIGSYTCACTEGHYGSGEVCYRGQCDDKLCSVNEMCASPTSMNCKCKEGFLEADDQCIDINECLDNICDENSNCINTGGSFLCECKAGFYGNGTTCAEGSCSDELCPANERCISSMSNFCRCIDGFARDESGSCVDIDECLVDVCDQNAACRNTEGSFQCSCNDGYFGSGRFCVKGKCSDDACPATNQRCISATTTECECKVGWVANDKDACEDIDECLSSNSCDVNSECVNTDGSYKCNCKLGYEGNGTACHCSKGYHANGTECFDINECDENNDCHDDAICSNTPGSYDCKCRQGFWGDGNLCYEGYVAVLNGPRAQRDGVWKRPIFISGAGWDLEMPCLHADAGTISWGSCSILWKNELYIYGGRVDPDRVMSDHQISRLEGTELKVRGKLPFKILFGDCTTMGYRFVFLCFAQKDECYRADNPLESFQAIDNSLHPHKNGRISASDS